ncbi:MAG: serine protease, partial [Armatimonadetes bacterium]
MIAALIGLGVGLLSAGASQGDASRIFRGAKDAVVTIGTPTGAGTGFITGDGTLLVTAAHIVEGENLSEIQTSLKDLRVVSVHAFDPDRDVAVLKLNKPASRRLALASALPQPGTEIFVIGTPLGFLQQTISEGIVSGIRKTGTGTLLQITAPVSPGSSGSPVLNSAGQVVGMVVGGIQEGQLLNFAVASSEIQRVIASARKPYEDPTATPPPKPEVSRAERIADLVSKLSGSWGDEAARKLADLGAIGALSECAKSSSGAVRKRAIDGLVRALSDS